MATKKSAAAAAPSSKMDDAKAKVTPYFLKAKAAATSEPVVTTLKTVGAVGAIGLGIGLITAIGQKTAEVAYSAMS